MAEKFQIQIENFHGPLDLLLQLIERKKLHITDISLSEVAEDFIDYLEKKEELPKDETADFVFIAACLMLIKSAALLPNLETTKEEESSIEDLQIRLKLYQVIKEATGQLRPLVNKQRVFWAQPRTKTPVFTPGPDLNLFNLQQAATRLVNNLPKTEPAKPTVAVGKTITLEEMVNRLGERLQNSLEMSFKDFVNNKKAENQKEYKVMVVVSFLSLLELLKRGAASAEQEDIFSDIRLTSSAPAQTPRYY